MNLSEEYFNKPPFATAASAAHTPPLPAADSPGSHQGAEPAEGLELQRCQGSHRSQTSVPVP